MMGEFDAITNGGLVNFSSLVDGAEKFDYVMNNQNNQKAQPSINYDQKQALTYDDVPVKSQQIDAKKSKLTTLNQ
jgi:hypothetical protein